MGKKVNPKVFRLGITKTWQSKWFGIGVDYAKNVEQDVKIRKYLIKKLREAGVDRVEIERSANKITVSIFTAKPGLIIGRGGVLCWWGRDCGGRQGVCAVLGGRVHPGATGVVAGEESWCGRG